MLKIDGVNDLPAPRYVPREQLKVGQWAIAVGVGFGGEEAAISAGIVSALSRISGRAVQTDANISPANYGGPLVDIEGRVIGLCVPLHPQSKEAAAGSQWYDSGIGFAVPLHGADKLMASLKAGKTVQGGYMGVHAKPADAKGTGVVVSKVQKGSAAEKAGIKPNDRILSVDGEGVIDVAQLRVLIGRYAAGDKIKVKIRRGEEELEIEVTLAVAAPPKPPAKKPPKLMPKPAKPAPKKDA